MTQVEDAVRDERAGSAAALSPLARQRDVDQATRIFYERVREENREFIAAVDATEVRPVDASCALVIAPAAFYREHPKFGGDGKSVIAAAQAVGMRSRVAATQSTGSVSRNAEILARELSGESAPCIVATLSKGGADLRVALERWPELASKIRVWLNISGLIRGTPISESLLGTRWWQKGLLRGYLAYTRADVGLVGELSDAPESLLGRWPNLPAGLRIINVLGFPQREHLGGNVRSRHARMAHLGPNDGITLLEQSILQPGCTYPVWGADHFLRTAEVPAILQRLLVYAEALA